MTETQRIKKNIIALFRKNIKGKKADTTASNFGHDGKDGHWLEKQMGVKHNASNAPDIGGFEMKNHTTSKTTFGDWSPSWAIFKGKNKIMARDVFLETFGASNADKGGRFSWSGKPCPKIKSYNDFGQKLDVDKDGNILALYSFAKDKRSQKTRIIPKELQKSKVVLARWDARVMKLKVERKFNKAGWFKCERDQNSGVYRKIIFGEPINFRNWIEGVRSGAIFFDSGMYQGNPRPYAQWRASNSYWNSLVSEEYE